MRLLPLIIGLGITLAFVAWPAQPPLAGPSAPGPLFDEGPDRIASWSGNEGDGLCLVDANGDGTVDVVGYASKLLALHGKTGDLLWSTEGSSQGANLYCDPRGGLVLYRDGDLTLTGLDPASGRELWAARLPDRLSEIAFGSRCVRARASDTSVASLDLRTGRPAACNDGMVVRPLHRRSDPGRVRAADLDIELAPSPGPGTPRATVRATRGSVTVWQTPLPEIAIEKHRSRSLVGTSTQGIHVAGTKHGGPGIIVVTLDPKSGAILAKREEARVTRNDEFFMQIDTTNAAVYVTSFGMIHAYDPRTLAPLWWAGSMWAGR